MTELNKLKDVCTKIIYNTDIALKLNKDESEVYQLYLKEFRDFIFENWDSSAVMNDTTQLLFMWQMFKQQILGIENNAY